MVFRAIDADDSGELNIEEIRDFIESAGLSQPVASMLSNELFEKWDVDHGKLVDMEEFKSYFSPEDPEVLKGKQLMEARTNLLTWFEKLVERLRSDPSSPRRKTFTLRVTQREDYAQRMTELGVSIKELVVVLDAKVDEMLEVITDFHAKQRTVAAAKGRRKSQRRLSVASAGGAMLPRPHFCAESMDIAPEEYDASEDLEAAVGTAVPDATMSEEFRSSLLNMLQSNFLFHEVEEDGFGAVLRLLECFEVEAGMDVVEAGIMLDSMYVIEFGSCEVQGGEEFAQRLEPMSTIGSLALVLTERQEFTLSALERVRLWGLQRSKFRSWLARDASDHARKMLKFIKKVELLKPLGNETHVAIARAMTHKTFEAGDVIMKEGDKPDNFYVMQHGQVAVTKHIGDEPNYFLCNLGKGDFFGELAFLNDAPRAATITATVTTECYVLGKVEFKSIIGPLKEVLEERHVLRILKNCMEAFKQGDESVLKEIIRRFEKVKYAKGEYIIKEGDAGDAFFIIESGMCSLIKYNQTLKKNMHLAKLQPGKYFGERGLMPGENGRRAASIIAHDEDVKVLRLEQEDFVELVASFFEEQARITGKKFEDATEEDDEKDEVDEEKLQAEKERAALPSLHLRGVSSISISNLEEIETIGHGVFGNIKLVRFTDHDDGNEFQMKCMQKSRILQLKRMQSPLREKQALQRVTDFTYITKIHYTAVDHDQLYIICDCPKGGDVFAAVHAVYSEGVPKHPEFDGLATNLVVQWSAMIVSALEHLHAVGVVYRDLKPENIKITADGTLKLVDFSLSKLLPYLSAENAIVDDTYTLCGTLEYLAPEVVLSHGHSFAVDFWSLGILIYELFCKVTPFETDGDDQLDTLHRIVNSHQFLGFPHGFDPNAKTLIRHLLTPVPGARIGCWKGGFKDIKEHVFFYLLSEEIDWPTVEAGKLEKVYVPENINAGSVLEDLPLVPYHSIGLDDNEQYFGAF